MVSATTWTSLDNIMLSTACRRKKPMLYDYFYMKYPERANT